MILYRTIAKEADAEQVIDRSRFIAFAAPVSSKEEADAFFARIREAYKDASHVVPAFIVGRKKELEWASDAGEPQGTSGPPILAMLEKENLTNLAVAVVRYFGGRLLGTGGLVRAYSSSAKLAIEAAGIAAATERVSFRASFDYTFYGKLQNLERGGLFALSGAVFAENVSAAVETEPENEERVKSLLTEATGGRIAFGETERTVALVPLTDTEKTK